jgi:hypothetical protein
MKPRIARTVVTLMSLEAGSLAVVASLHLSHVLAGGKKPFRPTAAGIAEAVIALALLGGILALRRSSSDRRAIAAASVGFAIVGFVVGLGFTLRGGDTIDIAYHATVLPVLLATLLLLLRAEPMSTHEDCVSARVSREVEEAAPLLVTTTRRRAR